ncbi:hypothetical protein ACYSNO_07985 [Enterococcus sp. LJL98]
MMRLANLQLKKQKAYHGFLFLVFLFFFVALFLGHALTLSLDILQKQPLLSEDFLPFLNKLIQKQQELKRLTMFFFCLSLALLTLGKRALAKDPLRRAWYKKERPAIIGFTNAIENSFVLGYLLISFLVCLLIFPAFFEKHLLAFQVFMTDSIPAFPHQLEEVIQVNPKEPFIIRATNTQQIFEYLFSFSQKSWSRLFLFAYLRTALEFFCYTFSISFIFSWLQASWQKKKGS